MVQISTLFTLDKQEERHQWLLTHYPQRDKPLISHLWSEAEAREHRDPQAVALVVQVARELAELWQDRELEAIALRIEASMQRVQGQHDVAMLRYQAAIQLYNDLGLHDEAARAAVGPLDTLMYLGRYDKALEIADWAIARMLSIGDDAVLARLLVNRGNIYARLADYPAAQKAYHQAHRLFTRLDQPYRVAMVEANEANVLTNLNRFAQAEDLYQQARSRFVAADLPGAVAQIDHNLAYLAFAQGDYQRALQRFAQARAMFAAQQNSIEIAYVDLYRAEIYLALNLWQEVLDIIRATRPIFEEALMQWESGQLLLMESALRIHWGHLGTADSILTEVHRIYTLEKNPFWIAVTEVNQGILAWRKQEPAVARGLVQKSLHTFVRTGALSRATQCAVLLGEIALDMGDWEEATRQFQSGLTMIEDIPLPAISYGSHFGLARIHQQRGAVDAAIAQYRFAVDAVERAQATIGAEDYKIAFRRDKLAVYEALILLYMEQRTPEAVRAAFDLVERVKARSLLDIMARLDEEDAEGIPDEFLLRYEALKRELNWYYYRLHTPLPDTDSTTEQQRTWRGTLQKHEASLKKLWDQWHHPDLTAAPRNPGWTISSTAIQATLPPDTLLLEFFAVDEKLFVFGLTTAQMWTKELPVTRTGLAHLLDQLRFQMNKFSYGASYRERHAAALLMSTDDVLHTLYTQLLAPLPEIHAAAHLIVVPHGLLHYVPFHALRLRDRYLMETQAVSYAPSATVLHRVMETCKPVLNDPPLLMGVNDATIPHVEEEILGVKQLFPAAQVYLGAQATTSKLLSKRRRSPFLHISTHAMFRQDNPNFSSLKLADGWLSVNEIYRLAATAPLVTLSACETGRSEVAPGDELIGLCRGFFGIGTQSLVVSLWRVEDRSTAQLMVHFYKGLREGETVYRALRRAQLTLLETHRHPYYWAPFVLTGNPALTIT